MSHIACFDATVPVIAQIVIGLVIFAVLLRSMRNHSVAYTGLVMLAALASFGTQNLMYVSCAIGGAMLIALFALCTRGHACNN